MVFFKDHDIGMQMSTPYRPQQKGVMEDANCTIENMARNMFYTHNLHKSFWVKAVANLVAYKTDVQRGH